MLLAVLTAKGQGRTSKLTVYPDFLESVILLKSGRYIQQPLTNIFLKNSSLLYLQGDTPMEANMDQIVSVKFPDRLYVKIDTLLAYPVDSIGNDVLYCATLMDLDAYHTQLRNNQMLTNLTLTGMQIDSSTIDIGAEDDRKPPLINIYYYYFKGKYVKCHERNLLQILPKEKKRVLRTFCTMNDFSWTDTDSLMKLLKGIQ